MRHFFGNTMPGYAMDRLMEHYGEHPAWLDEMWALNARYTVKAEFPEKLPKPIVDKPPDPKPIAKTLEYERPDLPCPYLPEGESIYSREEQELFWAKWNGKLWTSEIANHYKVEVFTAEARFKRWCGLAHPETVAERKYKPRSPGQDMGRVISIRKDPDRLTALYAMFEQNWRGELTMNEICKKARIGSKTYMDEWHEWDKRTAHDRPRVMCSPKRISLTPELLAVYDRVDAGELTKSQAAKELGLTYAQFTGRHKLWTERGRPRTMEEWTTLPRQGGSNNG